MPPGFILRRWIGGLIGLLLTKHARRAGDPRTSRAEFQRFIRKLAAIATRNKEADEVREYLKERLKEVLEEG